MNWGLQDLPERVQESSLCFVVRKGPRASGQQARVDLTLVKALGWILNIRRQVLTEQNRSLGSGSITLLAPHYKEGMEKMYASLRRVVSSPTRCRRRPRATPSWPMS